MNDQQAILSIARDFLRRVSDHFPVRAAYLYGSRARGEEHTESDADVAILLDGQKGDFLDSKLAMDDIAYDALLKTGIRIQPLPIWEEEWNHPQQFSNPFLLNNIAQDGIPL